MEKTRLSKGLLIQDNNSIYRVINVTPKTTTVCLTNVSRIELKYLSTKQLTEKLFTQRQR